MSESPKRPADAPRGETPRVVKPAKSAETAQTSDSVPVAVGPFTTLPTQFGRYRIEKLLGKGAMGAVYLAHDTQLDRAVALKVARVSATGSAKLIKRMETEAKAAAKIDHDLICKVYDFGEIDGIRFIALQYIAGEDLKSYLKRVGRKREPEEAIGWIVRLAGALEAAHEKGVLHRDLKPENIMLNRNDEPVIMDFGLARSLTSTTNAGLTQGMILGTAAYMSPEQAIGKAEGIDHRSDLYALGVILFEMLTGEWPFTGSAIEVMGQKSVQEAPSPLSLCPKISPQLAAVCQKMIARKREDRYSTCAEIIAALGAVDLKAPMALEMEVEMPEASSPLAFQGGPSFDFLDGLSSVTPSFLSTPIGKKAIPAKKSSSWVPTPLVRWWRDQPPGFRWTILGASATCLLLLATTLFFRNDDALVKIEVHADDIEVTFRNETLTLSDGPHKFKVKPGDQTLHIKSSNVEFDTDTFTLKRGDNPAVTVELVESEIVAKLGNLVVARRSLSTTVSGNRRSDDDWKSWRTAHLLDMTDIARDSLRGQWELTKDKILKQTANGDGQISFPIDPPLEYSVSFEGSRTPSTPINHRSLGIVLPMQGRTVMVHIDTDNEGGLSGLVGNDEGDWEESTLIPGQQLPDGEKFYVRCVVRKDSLDIFWQGHRRIHWQGKANELGCAMDFQPKGMPAISLACQGPYEFSKLRLAPLKLSATDEIDLMKLINVRRDTLQDAFRTSESSVEAVNRDSGVCSILEIPIEPPEEYTLQMIVKRTSGLTSESNNHVIVGLVAGGKPIDALFDINASEGGGLELIDSQVAMRGPTAIPGKRFNDQVPFELEFRVSRERIVVLGDGRHLIDWPVDVTRFSRPSWHTQSLGLILGCANSSYEFSRVRLGPLPKPEPSPSALATGQRIDLLSLIEPERDALLGRFTRNADGSVQFPHNVAFARLRVPHDLPAEYEIHAEVEAPGGWAELVFDMPVASGRGSLLIDAWQGESRPSGLELDGGFRNNLTTRREEVLKPGTHALVVRAAKTGVQFLCDGASVIDWRGNPRRLATAGGWNVPGQHVLGIGCYFRPYRLKMLELRPLSIVRPPFPAITKPVNGDLLAIVSPDRDSIDGEWVKEGATLLSPWRRDDVYSALHIPFGLDDEYEMTAKVQRRDGADAFVVDIPVGNGRCRAIFDGWSSSVQRSGMDLIDGMDPVTNGSGQVGTFLPSGKVHDLRVVVQREKLGRYRVRGIAGGTEVISWEGYPSQLRSDLRPMPGEERDLFLRTHASFAISELTCRPLKPEDRDTRTETDFDHRLREMSEASRLKLDWPHLRKLALNWNVKWFRLPTNEVELLSEFPNRSDASADAKTTRSNLKWTFVEMEANPLKQLDWFGLRASTKTTLPAGRYAIHSESDDGVRIRVDDKIIFEHWAGRGIGWSNHSEFTLPAGVHTLQVDYFELAGGSACNVEFAFVDSIPKPGSDVEISSSKPQIKLDPEGKPVAEATDKLPPEKLLVPIDGTTPGETCKLTQLEISFCWCPPGQFRMGEGNDSVEVTLTRGFWLGETEVTQGQWKAIMKTEPWRGKPFVREGDEFPATYVSHGMGNDMTVAASSACDFCERLSEQERKLGRLPSGWKYQLPTEAQWEYACRAGTTTRFSFGDDPKQLSDFAWWGGYAGGGNVKNELFAHPVGIKKPNPWGMRDMHGNVLEWCADKYNPKLPGGRDPATISSGTNRVRRSGCWQFGPTGSAFRDQHPPDFPVNDLGFRIAIVREKS